MWLVNVKCVAAQVRERVYSGVRRMRRRVSRESIRVRPMLNELSQVLSVGFISSFPRQWRV